MFVCNFTNAQEITPHPHPKLAFYHNLISCEAKDGDGTLKTIYFRYRKGDSVIANLSKETLYEICKSSADWADYNLKYPLTYKFRIDNVDNVSNGTIMWNEKYNQILVAVVGEVRNAYNVPSVVTTFLSFDSKGEIMIDQIHHSTRWTH
jgi:hypothetical protein